MLVCACMVEKTGHQGIEKPMKKHVHSGSQSRPEGSFSLSLILLWVGCAVHRDKCSSPDDFGQVNDLAHLIFFGWEF